MPGPHQKPVGQGDGEAEEPRDGVAEGVTCGVGVMAGVPLAEAPAVRDAVEDGVAEPAVKGLKEAVPKLDADMVGVEVADATARPAPPKGASGSEAVNEKLAARHGPLDASTLAFVRRHCNAVTADNVARDVEPLEPTCKIADSAVWTLYGCCSIGNARVTIPPAMPEAKSGTCSNVTEAELLATAAPVSVSGDANHVTNPGWLSAAESRERDRSTAANPPARLASRGTRNENRVV